MAREVTDGSIERSVNFLVANIKKGNRGSAFQRHDECFESILSLESTTCSCSDTVVILYTQSNNG